MKLYKFATVLCFIYASASYSAQQELTIDVLVNEGSVLETLVRLRGYDTGGTEGESGEDGISAKNEAKLSARAIEPLNLAPPAVETNLFYREVNSSTTPQTLFANLLQSLIERRTSIPIKIFMPEASAEFIDPEIWRVFAASDVTKDIVDENFLNSQDAYAVWMEDPYYGKKQACFLP